MMKQEGELQNNVVVSTVMSNVGLGLALTRLGVSNIASKVGDRHVVEKMKEHGAILGGEESGHIVFLKQHTTGDGLFSALKLLAAMNSLQQPLSRLARLMEVFPQVLINVTVTAKPPVERVAGLSDAITTSVKELGERGRVLVRYSGTEPVLRVMVEGEDEARIRACASAIAEAARKTLGPSDSETT
jgi:phosphoglucosamine mutase